MIEWIEKYKKRKVMKQNEKSTIKINQKLWKSKHRWKHTGFIDKVVNVPLFVQSDGETHCCCQNILAHLNGIT